MLGWMIIGTLHLLEFLFRTWRTNIIVAQFAGPTMKTNAALMALVVYCSPLSHMIIGAFVELEIYLNTASAIPKVTLIAYPTIRSGVAD